MLKFSLNSSFIFVGFKLLPHLNEVVTAVLFVLQFEVDEVEVDVFTLGGLQDPVTILLVVVVNVSELGVGEELSGRVLGGQVAAAHREVLSHEALELAKYITCSNGKGDNTKENRYLAQGEKQFKQEYLLTFLCTEASDLNTRSMVFSVAMRGWGSLEPQNLPMICWLVVCPSYTTM